MKKFIAVHDAERNGLETIIATDAILQVETSSDNTSTNCGCCVYTTAITEERECVFTLVQTTETMLQMKALLDA